MPDTEACRGNDLIIFKKSFSAILKLSVVFLQFDTGVFFFSDLCAGTLVIPDKQENNDRSDRQNTQNKYPEMLPYHIKETIGI